MSKNSNHQRYEAFQDWDRFMQNEYPSYKERKKKPKVKSPNFLPPEEEDLLDYYGKQ